MKKTVNYISLLFLIITLSCVEEYNAATLEFEDAIVIEASITNEFKFQKILLSRSYRLEENVPTTESGANVKITSSSSIEYTFHETDPGVYLSDVQFSAQPDINYQLFVSTRNGREYSSQPTELTGSSSVIEDVYAIRETSEDGVDGIAIYVDSFDPANSSRYYGYEYEETYQIIAPRWVPDGFIIVSQDPWEVIIGPRIQEEQFCYQTNNSLGRLTVNTSLLSEDRISKFQIKFIPLDDLRISSRYSILLKQHTQSAQAYNFYKTLNELSTSESLLSQSQPGFLAGNISSIHNPNEKVIGFFEASSIAEKRVFFNRSDFTDKFFFEDWFCLKPFLSGVPSSPYRLRRVSYFDGTDDPFSSLRVVLRACGDCTYFAPNIRPSFWVD